MNLLGLRAEQHLFPGPALRGGHLQSKWYQASAEEGTHRARTLPTGAFTRLWGCLLTSSTGPGSCCLSHRGCPSRPGSDSHIPGSGLAGKVGRKFRQETG